MMVHRVLFHTTDKHTLCGKMTFFSRKPISIRVRRGKKVFFCQKNEKMFFFLLLVSDRVVTLNCFTVRAHFFDFPIDFV